MPVATTVTVSDVAASFGACAVRNAATAATAITHVALMAVTLEIDACPYVIRCCREIGCITDNPGIAGQLTYTLYCKVNVNQERPGMQMNFAGRLRPLVLMLVLTSGHAFAGFDHELPLDQNGIWARKYQNALQNGVIAAEIVGSLWFGNDNELGHTFWQTVDASTISAISAQIMKRAFSRARPYQGHDPNLWFQGNGYESFPSGEVTLQASFVTPFIANYARDNPWVWSLELLPAYDAVARLKSQAHWQTDVLAGWALGTAVGYWSTTRTVPISVAILPRGLTVGFSKRF